jgi:hypothetical protein
MPAAAAELPGERADPRDTDPPEDVAGCWQDVADAGHYWLFERGRVRELHEGRLLFGRASYDVDHLVRSLWGGHQRIDFTFDDVVLVLTVGTKGTATRFRAVPPAARPAALDVHPLQLPEPMALPAERIAALQAELAKRHETDQAVRTDPKRSGEMHAVDEDDTKWLTGLVRQIGWIDVPRFGTDAAFSAFLLVQHSGDLPLMAAALPVLERDARRNGLRGESYALLLDRLLVNLGRRQRYGSQLGQDEKGRLLLMALEDRDKVDEWRKQLGMIPLNQYLDIFRKGTPPRDVVIEDDSE